MGSVSKYFTKNETSEISLNVTAYDFSVDQSPVQKEEILNIHVCLMKKNTIKWCLNLCLIVLLCFIVLLPFSGSLDTKCISLDNELCLVRPTLIDLNSNVHNQRLRHYPFMVSLDRCDEVVILLMVCQVEYLFQIKQKM